MLFAGRTFPSGPIDMKTVLAAVLTTILICAMTLGAMFVLIRATLYLTSLASPLWRSLAFAAELLLGVVLLLGTVWLATHLAVRIFAPPFDRFAATHTVDGVAVTHAKDMPDVGPTR
jgi:type IV secretory pathway TrbL component